MTLSGQLIAASMAMLAVEAAYVWYALGSRSPRSLFIPAAALAGLAIAASIFIAGKGITKARDAGFSGDWNLSAGKRQFNLQAILLLVALLMLFIVFASSGPARESSIERKVEDLTSQIAILRTELNKLALQQEKRRETNDDSDPAAKENKPTASPSLPNASPPN